MTEQDGDWMIWDFCLDGVEGVSKQIELSDNIMNKVSSKTTTIYMFDNVEI